MEKQLRGRDGKLDWEWLSFAASLPAKPFQFVNLSSGKALFNFRAIVVGVSLNNSATTGGLLTVYDGQDTTGEIIAQQGYGASSTQSQTFGNVGVLAENAVFLGIGGGVLTGTLWAIPLWRYNITPPGT